MRKEARAWTIDRNRKGADINWRLTTEDARIKLRRLYQKI
jgi:hypothetical protein